MLLLELHSGHKSKYGKVKSLHPVESSSSKINWELDWTKQWRVVNLVWQAGIFCFLFPIIEKLHPPVCSIVRIEFSLLGLIDVSNGHQLHTGDYW